MFWVAALRIAKVIRHPGDRPTWGWRLLGLVVGLGVGLGALLLLLLILDKLGANLRSGIWHATVLGVPGLLAVFGVGAVFVIGTSGRQFEEDSREWWSRLGGILFGVAAVWTAVAAAAIYGPWAVITFAGLAKGVSVAWLITSIAGVRAANSAASGNPEAKSWRELLAKVAPAVFIAGLLVLLAYGIHSILERWGSDIAPLCRVDGCPWQLYAADITLRLDSGIMLAARGGCDRMRAVLFLAHRRQRVLARPALPQSPGPLLPRREPPDAAAASIHRVRREDSPCSPARPATLSPHQHRHQPNGGRHSPGKSGKRRRS